MYAAYFYYFHYNVTITNIAELHAELMLLSYVINNSYYTTISTTTNYYSQATTACVLLCKPWKCATLFSQYV